MSGMDALYMDLWRTSPARRTKPVPFTKKDKECIAFVLKGFDVKSTIKKERKL